MSRFFELRLVDLVTRSKSADKHHKKDTSSEPDLVQTKAKINRKESICNTRISMPTTTQQIKNQFKGRVSSRPSKKTVQSSDYQNYEGVKNISFSDSPKLNISVVGCGSNENMKLSHRKYGFEVTKSLVSGEVGKNISSQKKPKTKQKCGIININSNVESIHNIHDGLNKKKTRKYRADHKFWESNLTGARRVSKRLTNLKLKNKNTINSEKATEKYIFTNILHGTSNAEKLSRVQGSVFISAPQNKFKMDRRKKVKKSTTKQPKILSAYESLSHKKQIHRQKRPNFTDLHKLKDANEIFERESCYPTSICGNKDNDNSMTSTSAVLKGNEEVISLSSVDKETGANDLVHIDSEMKETADLYQSIDENHFSENKTDKCITNTTESVISGEIQVECEENTKIIVVDIETEKGESSNVSEEYVNTIESACTTEKDEEEKETIGSTYIIRTSSPKCSDENHITSMEFNTASVSETSVDIKKTETNANTNDGIVDFTPADILILGNI